MKNKTKGEKIKLNSKEERQNVLMQTKIRMFEDISFKNKESKSSETTSKLN